MMLAGMGTYKNMGVADGFMVVQRGMQQTNVRVSRMLDNDMTATVGPLSIEVVEPYEHLKLSLAPGDHPVAAELEWRSVYPVYLEAPHYNFSDGRVIQDTNRYDQIGSWSGWLELDGERFDASDWWGVRDHSWGVRPDVGGFEPAHGRRKEPMLWLWTFATTEDRCVHFQLREDPQGGVKHFDGEVFYPPTTNREPVRISRVEHDIKFIPGTRDWSTLHYDLYLEDGSHMELEAEALQSAWGYRGTGYENGYEDSKGVGVVRGSLVESDVLDLSVAGKVTRDGEPYFPGHREQPARVTIDGKPGFGHLPVMSSGRIERYNLGRK
ncbi:DUF7065 domain-containing protein [Rhodococcus qingshengii]|uniref:hypothetical protein n=1 Tax=Rhodococcus qingshengii TaxID=334542 RepID=UPI0010A68171|nr:hypothetical protein [Rhodococcus qingshengii]THJ67691.1 hypothetical protein EU244_26225 [Rhodococcus qingshengii]